ncbi:hypothetical protein [Thiolapillus sp.]
MIFPPWLLFLLSVEALPPATTASPGYPSLELLEYIGAMEQTEDGELVDPLDGIPARDHPELGDGPDGDNPPAAKEQMHETP